MARDPMRYCPTCRAAYPARFTHCVIDGASLGGADQDPNIGAEIAERYRLSERLGDGGVGAVYRARHEAAGREVAVKLLHTKGGSSASRERFLREARVTGRLTHPNIVEVMDAGMTEDGAPYLVMELLGGEALNRVLTRGVPALATGLMWVGQAANGLAYAHEHGVIHRDVKPANLMIEAGGLLKLVDFGLALALGEFKLTATGAVLGTPSYMSPEQLHGQRAHVGFDVYGLGVVLYEVVTGRLPRAGSLAELHAQAFIRPPEALDLFATVPSEIEALALAMRAIDPTERPSMRDVARALDTYSSSGPDIGEPPQTLAGDELRWVRWLSLAGRLLDDAHAGEWPADLRQSYRTAEDALDLMREGLTPNWEEQTLTVPDDDPYVLPSAKLSLLLDRVNARTARPSLDEGLVAMLQETVALAVEELRASRGRDPSAVSNPRRALLLAAEILHYSLVSRPELQRLLPSPASLVNRDEPTAEPG